MPSDPAGALARLVPETDLFSDVHRRWERRQTILARAARLLADATPAPPATDGAATTDDWIARFWQDAELACDDLTQDTYARLLAGEAVRPGRCALATLRVLRYLDRDLLDKLGRLAPLAFDHQWVPNDRAILGGQGVSADLLDDLEEAGLVAPHIRLIAPAGQDVLYRWADRLLALQRTAGLEFRVRTLTRAGSDLARILRVPRDPSYFLRVADWIHGQAPRAIVGWAQLPDAGWSGRAQHLRWNHVGAGVRGELN